MRLGERLRRSNIITEDHLAIALQEQQQTRELLGDALVRLGFLNDRDLAQALAEHAKVEVANLAKLDPEVLKVLPVNFMKSRRVLPLYIEGTTLSLAMVDPFDIIACEEVRAFFYDIKRLRVSVLAGSMLDEALSGIAPTQSAPAIEELDDRKTTIVKLVDDILKDAITCGASDVHIEPTATCTRVSFRHDGCMKHRRALHLRMQRGLSHRLKIMANLDITETRRSQHGSFRIELPDTTIDIRMAVMPSLYGEAVVLRILDPRCVPLTISSLGFRDVTRKTLEGLINNRTGLTLVTGPTGCGKTTTIHSLLRLLADGKRNIMTFEDPIEYRIDGLRQTSINEAQGFGFAEAVRSALRMDPDVLFIGEIRDGETAQLARRAALTGHRVFTTLHCRDAFAALPRLADLGISISTLPDHLDSIVAQRLVRKLCPHCSRPRAATTQEKHMLGVSEDEKCTIAEAAGCSKCDGTGTKGRLAVAEVLRFTPNLEELCVQGASLPELFAAARSDGFTSLSEDISARILACEVGIAEISL